MGTMRYRLALDLGSTSLGWALIRLQGDRPVAIIKAGVRIFSDGRNPKDGSSLAVTRRMARALRRRRDRLLKRKHRMSSLLVQYGFFPATADERKALERLNPYELRAKGLDSALAPTEFARALFHINQRRGFKSNRRTDKQDDDGSALKRAIGELTRQIDASGADGKARTVGELLWRRMQAGATVRARYRETRAAKADGKTRIDKSYDLYINRAMIETEFDVLWTSQARFDPALFNETARAALKDCLLHQRPLKPVLPGRCTLLPDQPRAPLALPSQQRFRIYQEVNNLRIRHADLTEAALTLAQRDAVVGALEYHGRCTFKKILKLLKLPGDTQFNLEDAKREELKGNATSALLGKKEFFGAAWFGFTHREQDAIVKQLVNQQSLGRLIRRLEKYCGVDSVRAERISAARLPEGYGSLSEQALARILPALRAAVVPYSDAVQAAGFEHHSRLNDFGQVPGRTFDTGVERVDAATGEIRHLHAFKQLPYYGEFLTRYVGFGTGEPDDLPEQRYGRIANPTVHIGLNQVRTVVNALIARYGHPSEVIIEVARELKQSRERREEEQKRQATNQRRNERLRVDAGRILSIAPQHVKRADLQKLILWEELSRDPADRRCPYSGVQLSASKVLSDEVEIEHILPFSQTLDDSLNNKTVATRRANRVKGNRTPWEAGADFEREGWPQADMLARAALMPRNKGYRFAEDGLQRWQRDDKDFLARALNDTSYMCRVARAYVSLICPQDTRVIPGHMTAMLRGKFGLNHVLSLDGQKNRNDHRHHAVDACVIGVTDQGMLQRFARESARAREKDLDRLVENMPLPWDAYREHVQRAIDHVWVSHKPDHGYQGALMQETSYGIRRDGSIKQKLNTDGSAGRTISNLIRIADPSQPERHGVDHDGKPLPYKGYMGGNNYCIEITRGENGKWMGDVISTFMAYGVVREAGYGRLRHPTLGQNGQALVMRLNINDSVRMRHDGHFQVMRVATINSSGRITFAPINEANVDARNRDKGDEFSYVYKMASSLQNSRGRRVTISPIGELRDPGFKA